MTKGVDFVSVLVIPYHGNAEETMPGDGETEQMTAQDSEELILRPDKAARALFKSKNPIAGWVCLQAFNLNPKVSQKERCRAGRVFRHLVVYVPGAALFEQMESSPKNLRFRFCARTMNGRVFELTHPRSLAEIRMRLRDDVSAREPVWSPPLLATLRQHSLTQEQFCMLAEKATIWLRPKAASLGSRIVW